MRKVLLILQVILISFCLFSCSNKNYKQLKNNPTKQLSNYNYNLESSIADRMQSCPAHVLDYFSKIDKRDNYNVYIPTKEEKTKFEKCLNLLPTEIIHLMDEKLIGIYFIENFMGSALTDYVLDENNNMYNIMIINPNVLDYTISELLTEKESTCFLNDPTVEIKVNVGNNLPGLLLMLLHEGFHICDYNNKLTPYVHRTITLFDKDYQKPSKNIWTSEIWDRYYLIKKEYDFEQRQSITFYGLQGGPYIDKSEAFQVYENLSKTPFVSLYSTLTWAEDAAEFFTFQYLKKYLNIDYSITVTTENRTETFEPLKFRKVKTRLYLMGGNVELR